MTEIKITNEADAEKVMARIEELARGSSLEGTSQHAELEALCKAVKDFTDGMTDEQKAMAQAATARGHCKTGAELRALGMRSMAIYGEIKSLEQEMKAIKRVEEAAWNSPGPELAADLAREGARHG